jgi:hypothetical protein
MPVQNLHLQFTTLLISIVTALEPELSYPQILTIKLLQIEGEYQ